MATDRKQISVLADDATLERLRRVLELVSESLGVKVSQADVIRLALIELEKKFAPDEKPAGKKKK